MANFLKFKLTIKKHALYFFYLFFCFFLYFFFKVIPTTTLVARRTKSYVRIQIFSRNSRELSSQSSGIKWFCIAWIIQDNILCNATERISRNAMEFRITAKDRKEPQDSPSWISLTEHTSCANNTFRFFDLSPIVVHLIPAKLTSTCIALSIIEFPKASPHKFISRN